MSVRWLIEAGEQAEERALCRRRTWPKITVQSDVRSTFQMEMEGAAARIEREFKHGALRVSGLWSR